MVFHATPKVIRSQYGDRAVFVTHMSICLTFGAVFVTSSSHYRFEAESHGRQFRECEVVVRSPVVSLRGIVFSRSGRCEQVKVELACTVQLLFIECGHEIHKPGSGCFTEPSAVARSLTLASSV